MLAFWPNGSAWSGDPYHHCAPRRFASRSLGSEQWLRSCRKERNFNGEFSVPCAGKIIVGGYWEWGQKSETGSWFVLYDIVPDHFVMTVKWLLVNGGLVIRWPPRSPDLAPADFRRRQFQGFRKNVSAEVNTLVSDSLVCCIANLRNN